MGQGLGRNSPVKLTLGKDNYCALIERHGQWVRWRIANKCSCVNKNSMQPDIHCKICKGRGYTYTFQKSQIGFSTAMNDGSNIFEVEERFKDSDLVEVYDLTGERYDAEKLGNYIKIFPTKPITKGSYFTFVFRQSIIKVLDKIQVNTFKNGYYEIPNLVNLQPTVDGVYYNAKSDIVSIEKITDANGVSYQPLEFRLNMFRIENQKQIVTDSVTENEKEEILPIELPLTLEKVEFIQPFIFALLNQNLSKSDLQQVIDYQGDAILTYPYECDVSNDDILTVLAGSYTNKEVLVRQDYETDTIGVFFVSDIISCSMIVNDKEVFFTEGKDFILTGTNKIKWIGDNSPSEGDAYSIIYRVLPTYKVVKDIPQIRTSENQRFPKKAVVKLQTTYSESVGINRQEIYSKGFEGAM